MASLTLRGDNQSSRDREKREDLNISLNDLRLVDFGGFIENMNVIGGFNQSNLLQDLNVVSKNVFFMKTRPNTRYRRN